MFHHAWKCVEERDINSLVCTLIIMEVIHISLLDVFICVRLYSKKGYMKVQIYSGLIFLYV